MQSLEFQVSEAISAEPGKKSLRFLPIFYIIHLETLPLTGEL